MRKRILAWLLTLCLVLSAVPASAGAAAGQEVTADSVTVAAGNTATVTIRAANFKSIASLELFIYYDASVLTLNSASNGELLAQALTSVNTNEVGTVRANVAWGNGISGSGTLLTLSFRTSADAAAGTYPIKVAIGDAYGSDLSAATIGSTNGAVTVQRPTPTERFTLYAGVNQTTLQKDDVLTYRVQNSRSLSFASGDFTVTYDDTLFALESVEPDSSLKGQYSVNSSILGQVRFVYAGSEATSAYTLFTVKLRVIADVNTTTTVKVQASNVCREDLRVYLPGSYSRSLTLQKLPEVIDYPDAYLETEKLVVGEQSKSVFYLEAGAPVAAADFTISYDPETLRCVKVQQAEGTNVMVVVNENYAEGKIRFSYINQSGAADADLPLVEITWEPLRSPAAHNQITSAGSGVVDVKFTPVTLEYVPDSNCIFAVTVTQPTCTAEGEILHRCAACGKEERQPLEKVDHTWTGWKHNGDSHWYECSVCAEKKDLAAHTWSAWTVTKAATCTETGEETRSCAVCGRTETRKTEKIPHDMVTDAAVAATCTKTGLTEGSHCSRCDYKIAQEVTPKLGHNMVTDAAVAATCTTTGLTEGSHCSRCDYKIAQEVTPNLGHNMVTDAAVAATCTKTGLTEGSHCTRCDYKLVQKIIPALGHDYIAHEAQAATCTAIGWEAYQTCSRCDYTTYKELPALGHDYIDHEAQAATCTKIGWDAYRTCSRCDYTTYKEIPAKGHTKAAAVRENEIAATCTVNGSYDEVVYCSVCKTELSRESKTVDALGHDYIAHEAKAATCTEIGWEAYQTCSRCDYTTYKELPALGHDYIAHEAKAATCTAIGWDAYRTCSRCDYTTYKEIPALGHDEIVDAAVAATCTESGLTEGKHCSRCDYKIAQTVVPALGHDMIADAAVAATCTETGLTEGKHCSRCDYKIAQTVVPALGHDWAEAAYVWAGDNGSVTAMRACKRDAAHVERETAAATSAVTKEATYDTEGEIAYTATFQNPAFAEQTKIVKTPKLERPAPTTNPFVDVREGEYYYDAVLWAVENGITAGTSATTFSPDAGCTRAQVVTFLWRTAGQPEPASSGNPFTDVRAGEYYYKAVLWAVERGITNGTSATTFSPDDTCTRAQIVTFLWRFEGQTEPTSAANPFTDVQPSAYFGKAVLWAVENGITNGTSPTTFSPDDTCTRAQVVTFLYRDVKK